jgi:hypothetical protein
MVRTFVATATRCSRAPMPPCVERGVRSIRSGPFHRAIDAASPARACGAAHALDAIMRLFRTFVLALAALVGGYFLCSTGADAFLRGIGIHSSSCNLTLLDLTPLVGLVGALVAAIVAGVLAYRPSLEGWR